jgi:hypothetical protein
MSDPTLIIEKQPILMLKKFTSLAKTTLNHYSKQ